MSVEERIKELEKELQNPLLTRSDKARITRKIDSLETFGGIRTDDIEELDVMCITQQGIKSLTSG